MTILTAQGRNLDPGRGDFSKDWHRVVGRALNQDLGELGLNPGWSTYLLCDPAIHSGSQGLSF